MFFRSAKRAPRWTVRRRPSHFLVAQATTYRGLREKHIAEIIEWRATGVCSPLVSAEPVPTAAGEVTSHTRAAFTRFTRRREKELKFD